MMSAHELHVVFGTGPVGCWTARVLLDHGLRVRAVNRSGKRPDLLPVGVDLVVADVSAASEALRAAEGAATLYQATNPLYHQWHLHFPALQAGSLAAAKATGARFVSIENLYMYDSTQPMTEDSPVSPRSRKGELRARMAAAVMAAHAGGEVQALALRSSDYYGPGVLNSAFGDRVIGAMLRGTKPQILGAADRPHSLAYIEDVGRAAATLGMSDDAYGKVWLAPHAQALTQRELVELAGRIIRTESKYSVVGPMMLRMVGLFVPGARASVEMMYQFTEPFVVDSSRIEQTYGLTATPVEVGMQRTVEWYRSRVPR